MAFIWLKPLSWQTLSWIVTQGPAGLGEGKIDVLYSHRELLHSSSLKERGRKLSASSCQRGNCLVCLASKLVLRRILLLRKAVLGLQITTYH